MRRRTRATIGSLIAAVLLIGAAPAHADDPQPPPASDPQPPAGYATWSALYAEQDRILSGLASIRAAAKAAGDGNYSSAITDPTAHRLDLWWKGTPSPAVQAAITTARQSVPVNVYAAPYTEAQLVSETERIAATSTRFAGVSPQPNGSGVEVTWYTGQQDATVAATTVARATVGVTFAAETSDDPPQPTNRYNDAPPWKGGARTNNCTAGFAVNTTTGTKLLYAAHCASLANTVYDGAGQWMGTIDKYSPTHDISTIGGGLAQGAMYYGGIQSTLWAQVQDVYPSSVGMYVCSSGSYSGAICGMQIKRINETRGTIPKLTRVETLNHSRPAFGQGDSGGPVSAETTGASKVHAVGIISRGDGGTRVGCFGEQWTGRECFWRGWFADVNFALSYWGMSIRTQLG